MGVKRHSAEEIIRKLREAEVDLGRGKKMLEVCRQIGVTEQTYFRWRKESGGLCAFAVRPFIVLASQSLHG